MKNTLTYFLLLFFGITLPPACKKENRCDCIKRTGTIIIEKRDIQGFDKLYIEDNLTVFLTQDTNFSVKVEGGKNIVPLIKTELNNGTLIIKNNNRCNWTRSYDKPLNVYVSMPVINTITMDGTGKIVGTNTITTDTIDVQVKNSGDIELTVNNKKIISRMHGSGDVTLHGTTIDHFSDIGGAGYLQCENLFTAYTYLHTYTLGLCYVRCSNSIDCKIDYKGDVYCYGNPSLVTKKINGSGQLHFQ